MVYSGFTRRQSGQPYSVNDFSGGAASIFWGGGNDAITNPIVPVGGAGSTTKNPLLQGTTGVNANKPRVEFVGRWSADTVRTGNKRCATLRSDNRSLRLFLETGYASVVPQYFPPTIPEPV